jgi:hypothetical protein
MVRRIGVTGLGLVAVACVAPPQAGVRDSALSAPLDSASAVRAAAAKLGGGEFVVAAFQRDTAGYTIRLWLKQPPTGAILGGGGLVRVDLSARAVVVEREQ